MKLPTVAMVAVLLLAGCSDDGGDGTPTPAVPSPTGAAGPIAANETDVAPVLPVTFELVGCLQLRTFFPFPIAVFSNLGFQLPPGFTFASDDGQTVEAVLAWWFCPEGRLNNSVNAAPFEVGSMFAALPVVPPSDLDGLDPRMGDVHLDLVPLTWILTSQLASDHLGRIDGLRDGYVETGEVELTSRADVFAGVGHAAIAPASFGVFEVNTAIQNAPAPDAEGRYRMWLWPDGAAEVTSYLDLATSAGSTLGSGTAVFRFQGDPEAGAPPATAGTSQVVDAARVVVDHVVLK